MQAQIYQPTKSTMQSGTNNSKHWILEYIPLKNSRYVENFIGWISTTDMQQEVKIYFNSADAAINFAKSHNIEYELIESHQRKQIKKSYADNFR